MPTSPKTDLDRVPPWRRPGSRAGSGSFRWRVGLTWAVLLGLIGLGAAGLHLDFALIRQKLPFLLGVRLAPDGFVQGAALTLLVTAVSMVCALGLGLLAAVGRLSGRPIAFAMATFYGSLFRGTPLIVQVLVIYLALPEFGIVLTGLSAGIIALSLNYGAYLSEMIRAGMLAVPAGQREAARALGLAPWLIFWKVTGPQALRIIIPPAGTQFIAMLKDSSLVSLLGLQELNFLAQSYGRTSFHYVEMLASAAAIYWLLSLVFELAQARLERRFGRGQIAPDRRR
jgi:polar amino acid transport system permease protein